MRMFLRPRWLVVHVVVLGLVASFVSLGLWQLRRLDERRSENERITTNMALPVADLDATLAEVGNDPNALAYRRVRVQGRYSPADEVLLTPRSSGRTAGHHVLTPLALDDQQAVLVNRGWVPFADNEPPVEDAPAPSGDVLVSGFLVPTTEAARYGTSTGGSKLTYLSSPDVDRIQLQVDTTLYPFVIQLVDQNPPAAQLPIAAEPPDVSEGSHQSYAWQWFSFAAIFFLGYPLLLRRSLQSRAERAERSPVAGEVV